MIRRKPYLIACISCGMMAQNPVKHSTIFQMVGDWDEDDKPDGQLLDENNKRAFLLYQWGVWVTAWSRKMLELGIDIVEARDENGQKKAHFIYGDTDSIKYIGEADFKDYNKERIAECRKTGAFAVDPKGKKHYMGVFESEDEPDTGFAYKAFRTMGAKKYAFKKHLDGPTFVTISGVNKAKGGAELDKHNGLESFSEGFVFVEAGGTESVYSDEPQIKKYQIDGHEIDITPNISILPSTYTLGITGEYERIIKYCRNYIDRPDLL